jgi:hypothetical protein
VDDVLAAHGAVFSEALLHTQLFAVLAAFVAINTVMYCALTIAKVLPKVYVSDWFTSSNRRTESRSIHPEGAPPSHHASQDPRLDPVE